MLKFLMCSAIFAPCFMLPLFTSSSSAKMANLEVASFEYLYIEPALDRLENCKTAELDVFFYKDMITSHSAEYIVDGIRAASTCENARYAIVPIATSYSKTGTEGITARRADELSHMLGAHGIKATIADTNVQTDFDSLSANGRAAKLKIVFTESDSA